MIAFAYTVAVSALCYALWVRWQDAKRISTQLARHLWTRD